MNDRVKKSNFLCGFFPYKDVKLSYKRDETSARQEFLLIHRGCPMPAFQWKANTCLQCVQMHICKDKNGHAERVLILCLPYIPKGEKM